MCERADGNVVHSGFGKGADSLQSNSAGRLERDPARNRLNRLAGLTRAEIVEKNNVGPGIERRLKFIEAPNFYFNLDKMAEMAARFANCLGNR